MYIERSRLFFVLAVISDGFVSSGEPPNPLSSLKSMPCLAIVKIVVIHNAPTKLSSQLAMSHVTR